ncbi:glycosyltransferase [bacterium]|nr:glycosyltransferase [bacterium]
MSVFETICSILVIGYSGILLWLRGGLKRHISQPPAELPAISLIIPAHNESHNLPQLLECLSAQSYPLHRLQIILVDDRSEDDTGYLLNQYAARHAHVLALSIEQTPAGYSPKKHAIQTAINHATGSIIITSDADGRPGPQWLSSIVTNFNSDTDVVLGYAPYRTDGPFNSLFHRCLALEYFSLGAVAAAAVGRNFPLTSNGVNFAYRKDLFFKVDGFGETITELSGDDDLLLHRFMQCEHPNVRFAMDPASVVPNSPPENLKKFIRQRLRFSSKHPAYPASVLALLGWMYLAHVALLTLLIATIFNSQYLLVTACCFSIHYLSELVLMSRAAGLLDKRPLLRFMPFIFIPHLIYIVCIPIFAQIVTKKW